MSALEHHAGQRGTLEVTGRHLVLLILKEGLQEALKLVSKAVRSLLRALWVVLQSGYKNRRAVAEPLIQAPGYLRRILAALLRTKAGKVLAAAVASLLYFNLSYRTTGIQTNVGTEVSLLFGMVR